MSTAIPNGGSQRTVSRRLWPFMASIPRPRLTYSRVARSRSKNKVQVADSYCTTVYNVEARLRQQCSEVVETDIAVVMEMIKKPLFPLGRPREVDGQHSSSRLQNPSHFMSTLLASFTAQVMKHNRGKYRIELTVRKRHRFNNGMLEDNVRASFACFS